MSLQATEDHLQNPRGSRRGTPPTTTTPPWERAAATVASYLARALSTTKPAGRREDAAPLGQSRPVTQTPTRAARERLHPRSPPPPRTITAVAHARDASPGMRTHATRVRGRVHAIRFTVVATDCTADRLSRPSDSFSHDTSSLTAASYRKTWLTDEWGRETADGLPSDANQTARIAAHARQALLPSIHAHDLKLAAEPFILFN